MTLPNAFDPQPTTFGPPLGSAAAPAPDSLRLSRVIGNSMVIQRGVPVPVWGWAAPGAQISVTFKSATRTATADAHGAWSVTFPATSAGGPFEMMVSSGAQRIALHDILVGDVWVASGQSNMEWVLADAKNGDKEAAAANYPTIRHFKVPTSWAESPLDDVSGGQWEVADPAHAGRFTAIGYFFARDLQRSVNVPIGILHTSWGGSRIEPWMSPTALKLDAAGLQKIINDEREFQSRQQAELRAQLATVPTVDSGLVDGKALWATPSLDDADWKAIKVPALWESAGYPNMDGVAWYRTAFELTDAEAKAGVRLGLAMIDDSDISWVNGVEVGRMTNAYSRARVYDVPASALHAGRNVLAVRVEDTGGGGGIYGDPALLYVESNGARRPLTGPWKFKVGAVSFAPDGQHINKVPTVLYNAMVHPLLKFPVRGVIWYQGESNADRIEDAAAYRDVFKNLIQSWRKEWASGPQRDFPFLWVQLANYMDVDSVPPTIANWATLRESQTAALALPNTGQALAIDIGETKDIHPRNKQDVGKRLSLIARHVAYGESLEYSGPTFRHQTVQGGRIVLEFDHVGAGGLRSTAAQGVGGFAIAGSDRRFVWANARIEGNRVVVWSDRVPAPVAVRYAWANNPLSASLVNAAGLPASPFRTDAW